jgi:hypothetical protein
LTIHASWHKLPKKELCMKKTYFVLFVIAVFGGFVLSSCGEGEKKENAAASDNKGIKSKEAKILWKDIEIDMSFDEVKRLYPTLELFSKADEENPIDIYSFDGIVIQKEAFLIHFVFVDNKIIEVNLFPKNEFYDDKLFFGIQEELIQKYGNPVEQNSGEYYAQAAWNVQGVTIVLYNDEDINMLLLTYFPGEIKKEDNL